MFQVTLTVTDNFGYRSSDTQMVTVFNLAPAADFQIFPATAGIDEPVTFTDLSTDPDGVVANHSWEFGDGGISNTVEPVHYYQVSGTYLVNLTVMDDDGASAMMSVAIEIVNLPPNAGFSFLPAAPFTDELIQFVDTSFDPDGSITDWAWDLGDGNQSVLRNPMHNYNEAGNYTVTLTVRDDFGSINSTSEVVAIRVRPAVIDPGDGGDGSDGGDNTSDGDDGPIDVVELAQSPESLIGAAVGAIIVFLLMMLVLMFRKKKDETVSTSSGIPGVDPYAGLTPVPGSAPPTAALGIAGPMLGGYTQLTTDDEQVP